MKYLVLRWLSPYGELPRVEIVSSSKNLTTIVSEARKLIFDSENMEINPMMLPPKYKVVTENSWLYAKTEGELDDSEAFLSLEDIMELDLDETLISYVEKRNKNKNQNQEDLGFTVEL